MHESNIVVWSILIKIKWWTQQNSRNISGEDFLWGLFRATLSLLPSRCEKLEALCKAIHAHIPTHTPTNSKALPTTCGCWGWKRGFYNIFAVGHQIQTQNWEVTHSLIVCFLQVNILRMFVSDINSILIKRRRYLWSQVTEILFTSIV